MQGCGLKVAVVRVVAEEEAAEVVVPAARILRWTLLRILRIREVEMLALRILRV